MRNENILYYSLLQCIWYLKQYFVDKPRQQTEARFFRSLGSGRTALPSLIRKTRGASLSNRPTPCFPCSSRKPSPLIWHPGDDDIPWLCPPSSSIEPRLLYARVSSSQEISLARRICDASNHSLLLQIFQHLQFFVRVTDVHLLRKLNVCCARNWNCWYSNYRRSKPTLVNVTKLFFSVHGL